jgi:copper chaperone CopZ
MAQDVVADQLAVIRVAGMHCHQCEKFIQKRLAQLPGVHEAEVDFNSGQASILFDRAQIGSDELMQVIRDAGYEASPVHQ